MGKEKKGLANVEWTGCSSADFHSRMHDQTQFRGLTAAKLHQTARLRLVQKKIQGRKPVWGQSGLSR